MGTNIDFKGITELFIESGDDFEPYGANSDLMDSLELRTNSPSVVRRNADSSPALIPD